MLRHNPLSVARLAILITGLLVLAAPALALHPEEKSELDNLKQRIESLEGQKASEQPAEHSTAAEFGRIGKYITLHGLLEIEAVYVKPDAGDAESDLSLATAELSIEAQLNDYLGGHLTLLHEEEAGAEDGIDVDEAVISLTAPGQLAGQTGSLHAGRMYLPFGMFNSYMISDPLTLELGETRDTALLLALEGELWTLKAGTFNGGVDPAGDDDTIDSWVVALDITLGEKLAFGASYLSDLSESDNQLVQDASLLSDSVAGASAYLSAHCGRFGFEAEYLAALDDFDAALVAIGEDLTGRRPAAWNLELAWMPSDRLQLAARYEQADDFQNAVQRYGSTLSYGLFDHAIVALEVLHADANATGDDSLNQVTAQLALEF